MYWVKLGSAGLQSTIPTKSQISRIYFAHSAAKFYPEFRILSTINSISLLGYYKYPGILL